MNISDEQREKYSIAFATIAIYTALYPLIFYVGESWSTLIYGGKDHSKQLKYLPCNDMTILDMYGTKQLSVIAFFGLLSYGFQNKTDKQAWWWIFLIIFGLWMLYALIIYRFIPERAAKVTPSL